eukprot:GABV01000722.1.p1 GENE.GABV01000722.1~~GABV01000722.1.p1  ORF type:complete len:318 (-),score=95.75 GABV01000722.1:120-1073(-)
MHPRVAELCIKHKTHMVTASYVSPEMRELHSSAREAGVSIVNEVGLDPGIDHMSAKEMIDAAHAEGGTVTGFRSICGGLPAPEAADNPLGYKFSWSPLGVLRAAQNPARYLKDGKEVRVASEDFLRSAVPLRLEAQRALALEELPNRDSVPYLGHYGITEAQGVFRGTLRYQGWADVMLGFREMGLFDSTVHPDLKDVSGSMSWREFWKSTPLGKSKLPDEDGEIIEMYRPAVDALTWLGALSRDEPVQISHVQDPSVISAFCSLLEKKLAYQHGERDMVLMHHDLDVEFPNGRKNAAWRRSRTLAKGSALDLRPWP